MSTTFFEHQKIATKVPLEPNKLLILKIWDLLIISHTLKLLYLDRNGIYSVLKKIYPGGRCYLPRSMLHHFTVLVLDTVQHQLRNADANW